jgi:hypothetical protein
MTNNLRITQATPPGDYIDGLPGNEDIQSVAITPENVADYSLDLAPIAPTAPVTGTDFDAIAFLSGLVGDNSQGMFRQVTADPASTDARGFVIDGLTALNGANRVVDTLAFAGWAIMARTNMPATYSQFVGGPKYMGLKAGNYRLTVYVRVTEATSTNRVVTVDATCGTPGAIKATAADFTPSQIGTNDYTGLSIQLQVVTDLSSTTGIEVKLSYDPAAGTTLRVSHVVIEPFNGLSQGEVTDLYMKSVSVTKLLAGTINTDSIFMGPLGHIYLGPTTLPTGTQARVQLQQSGIYAWDGTLQTLSITNAGNITVTGTINATAGTITGNLTVSGTLTGGTISGALVKTTGSGGRIELDGPNNRFRIYASDGTTVLTELNPTTSTLTGSIQTGTTGQRIKLDPNFTFPGTSTSVEATLFYSGDVAELVPGYIYSWVDTSGSGNPAELDLAPPSGSTITLDNPEIRLFGAVSGGAGSTFFNYGYQLEFFGSGNLFIDNGYIIEADDVWHTPTYANGWGAFVNSGGTDWQAPRYKMLATGVVVLQGLLSGGTVAANTRLFTLPVGYRPLHDHVFAVSTGGTGVCRIDVLNTGVVRMGTPLPSGYISLDGVRFKKDE